MADDLWFSTRLIAQLEFKCTSALVCFGYCINFLVVSTEPALALRRLDKKVEPSFLW